MSSSTNSQPVFRQTRGSKAAIIRPVNRRVGKQSFVRIDTAESVVRPNARALQLEDYVAQIRESIKESPVPNSSVLEPISDNSNSASISVADDIALQQQLASAELTHADHVDVLRAVAKLDSGYQWIAENNRIAAAESTDISDQIAGVSSEHSEAAETTTQPLSQDLVNSIATAIASVLTDLPESALSDKIESGEAATPIVVEDSSNNIDDSLRLSPELPKPEYTLPVTEHEFVTREESIPNKELPEPINTVSLSAAAWSVPEFRWPVVTDQILAIEGLLDGLANQCESILSPFGKTIAVTAPTRGQGTSTMAMTLARLFASGGRKVLLVDGDIMKPNLSKTVGLSGVSWYQNWDSSEPVGESIIQATDSGVCIMPLDAPVADVSASSAPIFDELESRIDKVRSEFDLVVIDAGPVWQIVDEISSNSHLVDVAMLVNQDTYSNGFAEARERLMDRGIFKFIAAQNSFARKAG